MSDELEQLRATERQRREMWQEMCDAKRALAAVQRELDAARAEVWRLVADGTTALRERDQALAERDAARYALQVSEQDRDEWYDEVQRMRAALKRIASGDMYSDSECLWCGEQVIHSNECPSAIAIAAVGDEREGM